MKVVIGYILFVVLAFNQLNASEKLTAPDEVEVLNLTVSGINQATLSWVQPIATDIDSYQVLKYNKVAEAWNIIATINDPTITSYVDIVSATTIEEQLYKVLAIDDAGKPGPAEDYFNTIYLESVYNQCGVLIDFNWNPYIDGQSAGGVIDESKAVEIADDYELWVSNDGVSFNYFQTISKGIHQYRYNSVPINVTLYFQIRANLPNGQVSISNIVDETTTQPTIANEKYIRNTTVVDEETIQVNFFASPIITSNKIRLLRSENGGSFVELDELNIGTTSYIDSDVNTNKNSYTYMYELIDACNNVRANSNPSSSILLELEYDEYERFPVLNWNFYKDYQNGVDEYYIEKYLNGELVFLDSVSSTTKSYNDTLHFFRHQSYSSLCYVIRAVEEDGNSYGFKEVSSSNTICIDDKSTVFIPTGFVLNGRSGDFKPVFTYVTNEDYRFIIYNRWGQVLFETKNPFEGWNGTYRGAEVQVGTYAYKLFYKDDLNEQKYLAGSVTVIR